MQIDSFNVQKKLGEGQYATTYLVKNSEGKKQAAKLFKRTRHQFKRDELKGFHAEAEASALSHPNLVQTLSCNLSGKVSSSKGSAFKPYIIQELCEHGDLFSQLFNAGAFSEQASKCIFAHLLDGVRQLRAQGKSHLDLKPENILVAKDYAIKIGDFGFLSQYEESCSNFTLGTQGQNSPQISQKEAFDTEKADMFSLGALLVTILLRNPLFVDTDADKDYNFNQLIRKRNLRKHLLAKSALSNMAVDFLCSLLEFDEDKRLGIEQAERHPWLDGARDHQDLLNKEFNHKTAKLQENFSSS